MLSTYVPTEQKRHGSDTKADWMVVSGYDAEVLRRWCSCRSPTRHTSMPTLPLGGGLYALSFSAMADDLA